MLLCGLDGRMRLPWLTRQPLGYNNAHLKAPIWLIPQWITKGCKWQSQWQGFEFGFEFGAIGQGCFVLGGHMVHMDGDDYWTVRLLEKLCGAHNHGLSANITNNLKWSRRCLNGSLVRQRSRMSARGLSILECLCIFKNTFLMCICGILVIN